jgi:hypothetical protein
MPVAARGQLVTSVSAALRLPHISHANELLIRCRDDKNRRTSRSDRARPLANVLTLFSSVQDGSIAAFKPFPFGCLTAGIVAMSELIEQF